MRRPGIHLRLFIAAIMLICATSFTLGYVGIKVFHGFVKDRFDDRMSFMAKYLALNAELGILIGEKDMLENLAKNILSEKDVAEVSINSSHEGELVNLSRVLSGPFYEIEAPVVLKTTYDESRAFSLSARPDDDIKGKIGTVRVKYSTAGINQFLKQITIRFIVLAAGLATVCVAIFYFLSRSIVAPLTNLARAAKNVGEGDLKIRVESGRLPETHEVAVAFNAMLDSIEKSRQAVEEANKQMMRQNTLAEMGKFSLMIAHEVKNPLGIIKSSIDVIKKKALEKEQTSLIGDIEEEIARLNRLIEDFLAFARPVKPSFRELNFNPFLKKVIDRFQKYYEENGVEIRANIPATSCNVFADADLCERMIGNILKNAIEAVDSNGIISVDVDCASGVYMIEISDNGEGIDDKIIENIFEPFFTTRSKGTGLGLAFVDQVVKAHGGEISAENQPRGGGALFRVKLPLTGINTIYS